MLIKEMLSMDEPRLYTISFIGQDNKWQHDILYCLTGDEILQDVTHALYRIAEDSIQEWAGIAYNEISNTNDYSPYSDILEERCNNEICGMSINIRDYNDDTLTITLQH